MPMTTIRPYVLTIAGHDPSGGAGLSADLKTMEAIGVQGLSVCTAFTCQTEHHFEEIFWLSKKKLKKQLTPLLETYPIDFVKIGIIEDLKTLHWLVIHLKEHHPDIFILWDPVIKASTGFTFHKKMSTSSVKQVLEHIDMLTPNWEEISVLSDKRDPMQGAKALSKICPIYLKGGHHDADKGVDYLWMQKVEEAFVPEHVSLHSKHGSGCVFSSALISYLARGYNLASACIAAKLYVGNFLDSTETLLGIHYRDL
jgi:hydroxymethylpyrimidine/phosphomethylpyrimidine kinase